ncbi:unnamed protein product [Mesocestoides corti]|uniref:B-box type zinc finger protein ncl-1 n=1 Tax=Mesocestoides corti TaxID=53468 RepID=A0A0R3UF11_MESCO|nr:unnamed protein product [Mesocestoides corti]
MEFGLFSEDCLKEEELEESSVLPRLCAICNNPLKDPLILNCLHIFDQNCLVDYQSHDGLTEYVKCPKCARISGGLKTLEPFDMTVVEQNDQNVVETSVLMCSACTEGKEALYRCIQCAGTLCGRCRDTHKVMKMFSSHEVLDLTEQEKNNIGDANTSTEATKAVACADHPNDVYSLFCMQCRVPLCKTCDVDHRGHITFGLSGISNHVKVFITENLNECRVNQNLLRETSDALHSALSDLSLSRDTNKAHIEELCNAWKSAIDSVKEELLQKNREVHSDFEMKLMTQINHLRKTIDHIDFVSEFCLSYFQKCPTVKMSKLVKAVLGSLEYLKSVSFQSDLPSKIVFVKAPGDVREFIRSHFGSFDLPYNRDKRMLPFPLVCSDKQPPLNVYPGDDISNAFKNLDLKRGVSQVDSFVTQPLPLSLPDNSIDSTRFQGNGSPSIATHRHESINNATNSISPWGDLGTFDGVSSPFKSTVPSVNPMFLNQSMAITHPEIRAPSALGPGMDLDTVTLLSRPKMPPNYNASLYEYSRMRSARCGNMMLLTKWGSLGCELGRLNSPHGFCLGFDEEIVVADTYNHRIQIFTKRGEFLSCFGVSGRVDGLLWYPRKVAIIRQSQRFVVCDRGSERSRMQLFSRSGHFVRRIQIKYIDIVAGLAINQHGHIVAIDSVTPSVFVMSEDGDLIRWFDCTNHMKEPSDVAIHGREYYICDFKAHCVVVFQEDGSFIRTIGGETFTDFPNGIDVSDHGDVLVGDSHGNRFHIAVFNDKGELLSEFVCHQTKVSRSCCLKITTEGYVVTLARSSNNVLVMNTLYIS